MTDHLDVTAVFQTGEQSTVNAYLGDGWALLSVAQDPYGRPNYVLGRRPLPEDEVSGPGDEVSPPGDEELDPTGWPTLVGVLRRFRDAVGRDGDEPFVVPLGLADVDTEGVALHWRSSGIANRPRALVFEETP